MASSQPVRRETELNEEEEGDWTKLDISSMQLVALSPSISIYSNITELYLQNNNLTRLPVELFRSLTKLKLLDLSCNKIHFLQPEICHLLQLRELNLNWNLLRELPFELGKLFRLEKLLVEGNPVVKPDPAVIKQGTQYCINFFRDRMQSGEPPPPREWVSANKSSVNIQPDGFRVFCYNVLAESYAQPDRINYCPSWALNWEYRKHRILKEIVFYEPDIICLQEVEAEQLEVFFQPEMLSRGYVGKFHPKSRARTMDEQSKKTVDGCVIFWKRDIFTLASEDQVIEYQAMALLRHDTIGQSGINRMMTKDNIALTVLLKPIKGSSLSIQPGAGENDCLLIVNTHIHWDPNYSDVKLMQVQMLVEHLQELSKRHLRTRGRPLPMVICGDFNSSVHSAVYKLLSGNHVESNHVDFCGQDYGVYSKRGLNQEFSLKSAYLAVTGSEPAFTNYSGDFVGVLDYIFFTDETISAERVLTPLSEEIILSHNGALPNPYMCSDHIPLACDFYGRILNNPPR